MNGHPFRRFICVACMFFVGLVYGQVSMNYVTNYSTGDGLTQNTINRIFQDKYGFLWLATEDGLNRFDGYDFERFRYRHDKPNSLSDNYVRSIYEDSKGRLWVGTYGGINLFNRDTWEFESFVFDDEHKDAPPNRIGSIEELPDGRLVLGTYSRGVVFF